MPVAPARHGRIPATLPLVHMRAVRAPRGRPVDPHATATAPAPAPAPAAANDLDPRPGGHRLHVVRQLGRRHEGVRGREPRRLAHPVPTQPIVAPPALPPPSVPPSAARRERPPPRLLPPSSVPPHPLRAGSPAPPFVRGYLGVPRMRRGTRVNVT
ncbi:hypothetical protein [Streptomyces sp. NPDC059262]|uniref:hypothetical protein n=1 Tax=Streptomyces sp. NPDC059262 TaxID=3346797 RepID=UPI00367A4111